MGLDRDIFWTGHGFGCLPLHSAIFLTIAGTSAHHLTLGHTTFFFATGTHAGTPYMLPHGPHGHTQLDSLFTHFT